MMYKPDRISLRDAASIVAERVGLSKGRTNPLLHAIRENAIPVQQRVNGTWIERDGAWYESADVWWPSWGASRSNYKDSCEELMVARDGLDRLWPDYDAVRLPEESFKKGRPPKDWDAFHREVIRLALHPDGLPESQSDLERIMMAWCEREWGSVGESTIRGKVSSIYAYLRDARK